MATIGSYCNLLTDFLIVSIIDIATLVIADAAVIFFTIFTTWRMFKLGQKTGTQTKLVSTLLRNGIFIVHL